MSGSPNKRCPHEMRSPSSPISCLSTAQLLFAADSPRPAELGVAKVMLVDYHLLAFLGRGVVDE